MRNEACLRTMSDADRATVSSFIAAQFLRAPRMRVANKQIADTVLHRVKAIAPAGSSIDEFESAASDAHVKFLSLVHLADAQLMAPVLSRHKWVLLRSVGKSDFWISDSPVTLHNDRKFGPYGNLGIALPGIQIYLPLSPRLTLALWEDSVVAELKEGEAKQERERKSLHAVNLLIKKRIDLSAYDAEFERLNRKTSNIHSGMPIDVDDEAVTFCNWLQYQWSYRFIASAQGDFGLAVKIAADHPELREGIPIKSD